MSFDPDLNRQAQEVIFSRKLNKPSHPKIVFNSAPVVCTDWQKHLGMYLDKALNFNLHIKEKMSKAMKGIGVIQKLNKILPCHSLITIYKSFARPHLGYGDIIYDQPNNESSTQKIERIQYKAVIVITGAIKGTFQSKLYSELGFESLKLRRWFRKLCTFFQLKTSALPEYLFDFIPQNNHLYNTCFLEDVATFCRTTDAFKYSFFSIYNIRMEQIGEEDKTIFNSADFQKFPIKVCPTCT